MQDRALQVMIKNVCTPCILFSDFKGFLVYLFAYSCRTSNRKSLIGNGQSPVLPRPHSPLSAHAGNPLAFVCASLSTKTF